MTISIIGLSLFLLIQTGTGSIEGTVISATTRGPIAGAQITAVKTPAVPNSGAGFITGGVTGGVLTQGGLRSATPPITSDSNGHFVLEGLDAGRYLLRVTADGYASQQFAPMPGGQTGMSTSVTLNEGQNLKGVTFHLTPAGNVSGRITGTNGQPMANIEVALLRVMYDADGKRLLQGATALTDDRGDYRLFWVPPGRYYLSAGSPSRPAPGRVSFLGQPGMNKYPRTFYPTTTDPSSAAVLDLQPGGEINGIDIRLNEQATYRVRGRVIDSATGQIARNVNISITPRTSVVMTGSSSSGAPYNGSDGTFELRDVASGSYWIIAQVSLPFREPGGPPPRPPMAIAPVDVSGADVDGVVLNVIPPMTISGRVRIDGQSALAESERVSIILSNPQPGFGPIQIPLPARTNADGTFQVSGVHPGEYRLNVVGLPSGPQNTLYVAEARLGSIDALSHVLMISGPVSDQLEVVLGRNSGQLKGTVTDNRLQSAPAVQVALVPDNRERRDLYRFTFTDSDGKFAFAAIPPAGYKLFAATDLDANAFFDPDVIRRFEPGGTPINIGDSTNLTVELKVNVQAR